MLSIIGRSRQEKLYQSLLLIGLRDTISWRIPQSVSVEMAIRTWPFENGRPATQADRDYLGERAALFAATAAHSDAAMRHSPKAVALAQSRADCFS
jgi:hypothetical protein